MEVRVLERVDETSRGQMVRAAVTIDGDLWLTLAAYRPDDLRDTLIRCFRRLPMERLDA